MWDVRRFDGVPSSASRRSLQTDHPYVRACRWRGGGTVCLIISPMRCGNLQGRERPASVHAVSAALKLGTRERFARELCLQPQKTAGATKPIAFCLFTRRKRRPTSGSIGVWGGSLGGGTGDAQ